MRTVVTSPIGAISGISGVSGLNAVNGLGGLSGVNGLGGLGRAAAASGVPAVAPSGQSFASLLAQGLQSVQAAQTNADSLAIQVADGTLSDPARYTMAATEAQLGLQLTTAIRNKAVDAFQEIMRMQA
ncbi:MAG: flagellar hook-basal body complex protein FliE [Actinoplanes sp.]|jgi:flagellar hook-basal body complex protein FliE|nr:flagellar hook-basal body complex protein FliE [Actinoplanes sp.]MDX6521348.1 flagellar hook-basal body complex protein FliE [Gaiellales bacterium]